MNFKRLDAKRLKLQERGVAADSAVMASFEKDFVLTFVHNSTAIEGNTLTKLEAKAVLEDGIAVGGKSLREIYELVNHKKAYDYVKKCIEEKAFLNEDIVKDLHAILTENIFVGGIYRHEPVRISGAGFKPPCGNEMFSEIKNFYLDLSDKEKTLHPIELAAWTHAEFVRIHPFVDGNGRTARLLMNFQLLSKGFLAVSVAKEDRLNYYNTLEDFAVNGNLSPFAEYVAALEEARLDELLGATSDT